MRRRALRWNSARLRKLAVERLEGRALLATFVVTNTNDDANMGSLRYAITQSNATPGSNTIDFNIATTGAVQTINVIAALPKILVPVTIDGTSEPLYAGKPLVDLNGSGAGSGVDGLDISAGASTVEGLSIGGFSGEGINLSTTGGNLIAKDYLGVNAANATAAGNKLDGLLVQVNSDANTISGNVISANTNNGIYLNGQLFGATNPVTSGNLIAGNLIGTDPTGMTAMGNGQDGVYVQNAPDTTVGGTTPAARNIISANGSGMELYNNSDNSIFEGNYIGTNVTGTAAIGNTGTNGFHSGIVFRGISNSTVGGTAAGAGNVLSGNLDGISCFVIGSSNLAVEGNFVGTNAAGTAAIPNTRYGVDIAGPTNVTVGGTVAGARNVISGNGDNGIDTFGGGQGFQIQGNYIGTDLTGTRPIGNGGDGVSITFPGVTIGGATAGAGNIIANNGATATFDHDNVRVTSTDIPILGNSIDNAGQLGIDLSFSNPQVAPVLTSAASTGFTSTVAGTLSGPADTYTLQIFATNGLDKSNKAEGQTLIGVETLTTTGTAAPFSYNLVSGFPGGEYVTATATSSAGETSEFSTGIVGTGSGSFLLPPTITATASSTTIAAGANVTDTFTITNPNAAAIQGVTFSDVIPADTTFVSGTTSTAATVTVSGGVATSLIGTVAAGQTVTVVVVLGTSLATIPSFTNLAEVVSIIPQTFPGTEVASATTTVTTSSDLAVTIAGPSGPTLVGGLLTYTVTATNAGPAPATGVTLADQLPAGVTFVSATPSSGPAPTPVNGVLTDDVGNLAVGATFTLTIVVTAGPGAIPTAVDTAAISGDQADPDMTNNSATFTSAVVPSADLAVTLASPTQAVNLGQNLVYTVTATNNGPSPATGVLITDSLPNSVTFVSATSSTGQAPTESNGTVSEILSTLAAGATEVITITVTPTLPSVPSVSDSAAIMANESDPNQADNSATLVTTVNPVADVAITGDTASATTVTVGTMVAFTINLANAGPSEATNVNVSVPLPTGLTFVSGTGAAGSASESAGVVTVPVGILLAGGSSTVTITVLAAANGTFPTTATVGSDVVDSNPSNNTGTASVTVTPIADVSLTLSGTAGPIYTNTSLTYTAVVTNAGPSPATNVEFADPIPAGTTFVGVEANGVLGSVVDGVAELALGTIAPGTSVEVILVVVATQAGVVTDSAVASATEPDPDTTNNAASVSTTIVQPMSTVAFSSAAYVVGNNQGDAVITLVRTGYTADAVTVDFTTGGGDAIPGVDYTPVTETVDFPAGATSETVLIPVFNNAYENHNSTVGLLFANATGSAIFTPVPTTATLTIVDTDPVLIGPSVTALKLSGYVNSITAIEIDTTGGLNPSSADNPASYTLTAYGSVAPGGLPLGTVVPVATATYDPATGAVVLVPSQPLPGNELFLVDVHGAGPTAVVDLAGNPLNSVFGSKPGSDYLLTVARGTDIVYPNENGDPVTLKLTGPGTIDVDRFVAGDLEILQVVGGVAGKTVVTGKTTPTLQRSKIGSILGLGQFGSIRLTMTTPPFYLDGSTVYPSLADQVDAPSIDTLLPSPPTTAVTSKSKARPKKVATPKHATPHVAKPHPTKAAKVSKPAAKHH